MNTDNLFLQSIDKSKVDEIQDIKRNKSFIKKIINDLGNIFHIYSETNDNLNSVTIFLKKETYHNFHHAPMFKADVNGVSVEFTLLAYYEDIIELFNKYESRKGNGESEFKNGFFGIVTIKIMLSNEDPKLNEKLRDIFQLMEKCKFRKKY